MTTAQTFRSTDKKIDDRDVIFYDGACGVCSAGTRRLQRVCGDEKFAYEPLQSPTAAEALHLQADEIPDEMKLLTRGGQVLGGVDAILHIAGRLWWAKPFALLAKVPPLRSALDVSYRKFAANRYRISQACFLNRPVDASLFYRYISANTEITDTTHRRRTATEILLALTPLIAVMLIGRALTPWTSMWLIAAAMWLGAKGITWRFQPRATIRPRFACAKFFAWPGTDPTPFVKRAAPTKPTMHRWLFAVAKIVIGVAMFTFAATIVTTAPLLAGWIACVGIVLALHFGVFELIAFAWRVRGVAVEPIMNFPIAARSVGDFWRRWNLAFSDFVHPLVFRPISQRFGVVPATAATFLFSGVLHDLVISIPARGGYGRPTAYFMIQCLGLLIEKTPAYRKLPAGAKRWIARAVVALPLPLLVPAIFLRNVIVPTLGTLGGAQ